MPQATRAGRKVGARADERVDAAQGPVARLPQEQDARAALVVLELVEVTVEQPKATGSLVRLVRDELDDDRTSREGRTERRPTEHARRVHDVGIRGPGAYDGERPRMPNPARLRTAHPADLIPLARGWRISGRHHLDPCPRSSRNAASSGAWLAGPPTSGGQIPETISTFTARRPASGRPPMDVDAEPRESDRPRRREDDRRDEHRERRPRCPPLRAQHGGEWNHDEGLQPVRDDP